MTKNNRCPQCGFSYAWDGKYCAHCRTGFPDRNRWAAFRVLRDFPRGIGNSRERLHFGAGCLRHLEHDPLQGGIALPVLVHEDRP